MTAVRSVRLPDNLADLIKLRSKEERVDDSTAIRQLIYLGAERYIMRLYRDGKISVGKAAELLDVSIYDIYDLARRYGIETGATEELQAKSEKHAEELL
ncbi:MAG: UPF0175 family protein [Candidatus Hydrothermarchaeales archaeon]